MSDTNDLSDMTPPEPRAERFGEGVEGAGARRERGVEGPRAGFFERIAVFLHDVRSEMRRVSWPSTTEIKNTTIITLIAMIFFAAYLFGVDEIWAFLIGQLVKLLGGA
jgi:preprotein translocase subunit SecE